MPYKVGFNRINYTTIIRNLRNGQGCTSVRQSFASSIIHALPLPPRHKDTKWGKRESLLVRPIQCSNVETGIWRKSFCPYNTAFSATDCTDFHRFSSILSGSSVTIRGKNKTRQCPGRNIQPGCSLCLCVFVVHLRELPRKNMTNTQRAGVSVRALHWKSRPQRDETLDLGEVGPSVIDLRRCYGHDFKLRAALWAGNLFLLIRFFSTG